MALTRITKGVIKPNENYDTHNINSTGIITATGFAGPVTGAITGNADTATLATNVTVSANNSTNETVYPVFVDGATGTQGVETDTGLTYNPSSNTLTAGTLNASTFGPISGTTASFSGNVSIGGTLTYEDVTNIDAVGLITARGGINISGGTATFAAAIDDNSDLDVDGHTNLDNVNIAGVTTFTGNIDANSTLEVAGAANFDGTVKIADKIEHLGDTNTNIRFPDVDQVQIETAGQPRFKVDSDGNITFGSGVPGKKLFFAATSGQDSQFIKSDGTQWKELLFGRGSSEYLRIDSDGRILIGHNASQGVYGTNRFQIQGTSATTSGMSLLRHGGSPYLALGSTGGSSVGAVNAVADDARLGQLTFVGADGTDVNTHAASIAAYVDGSVSSNTVPGRLVFATSSGPGEVERLRIGSTGKLTFDYDTAENNLADIDFRTNGGLQIRGFDGNNNNAKLYFGGSNLNQRKMAIIYDPVGGWCRGDLHFCLENAADLTDVDVTDTKMVIKSTGQVGIGTDAPAGGSSLHIQGGGASDKNHIRLTADRGLIARLGDTSGSAQAMFDLYGTDGSTQIVRFISGGGDNFVNTGGYFGVGKSNPGCALDVLEASSQTVASFLSTHSSLGGGVRVKNNNARGGVEFLYKDGTNTGAFLHSTGGWTWDKELQLVGSNAKLRIGTTSGSYLLNVDTGDGTDGHIMAAFNGEESSNHAGLNIAHYLCGSDDNRTGLYWEHQNVSNERMWMGDDKRLYLKNSNPTESTAQGRYIMTVAGGTADFPDGTSYDNAAKSALEIKKHWPNIQTGNYWIYDYNGTPRQIRCDMEIDGGGWMLWNDYNTSSTSMNEALGNSSTSPHSGLGRGNYNNYAYYQVLIRASKISDGTQEALHTIVQLDHNGNLFRKYDYGEEFFREDVGDPFNPTLTQYFQSGSTGEYIKIDGGYQPQLGASGWQTFSGGGWQQVWIRELDTRLSPGDVRSYAMHERVYGFNDNGVPVWRNTLSMGPQPYWTDIRGDAALADGSSLASDGISNDQIHDRGHTLYSNNGNNGDVLHGRCHGVFLGAFEISFKLSYWWGWSVGNMNAGIGVEEQIRDGVSWPYYQNASLGYAGFGLMNNSSNNLWYPSHFYNGQSAVVGNSGGYSGGANNVWNIMWRTSDGTIKLRRRDNTHGTYTFGKFVGPLVFGNGYQSPSFTELGLMWDSPWNTNGNCMR